MTMIMTENGQTMHIQHDVMNPRPYSRMYQLTGTEGFANKYPVEGYTFRSPEQVEGVPDHENLSMHSFVPADVKQALMEQYKHPIQKELEEKAKKSRRTRWHGLHHGLPVGILFTPRPPSRSRCL